MEDYPSNSKAKSEYKGPRNLEAPKKDDGPRTSKVVTGKVVRQKKSLAKRFTETFLGDARGVGNFVLFDVLVPAARDMVVDAGQQALERAFYGDRVGGGRRNTSGYRPGGGPHATYGRNTFGSGTAYRPDDRKPAMSGRGRKMHNFDEIVLDTRGEAVDVIDQMFTIVSQFEQVTVADLYDMIGVTADYTDRQWGWTDIRGAGVVKVRNGYLLDLPRPEPLSDR